MRPRTARWVLCGSMLRGGRFGRLRRTASRRARIALVAGTLALVGTLLFAGSAAAITPTITSYSSGMNAGANAQGGITAGPDGNLWFADYGTTRAIGAITPSGAITEFGLPSSSSFPDEVAAGPDGNLWFTDCGSTAATKAIGRITPAGVIDEFPTGASGSCPNAIVPGSDGNLWFTDAGTTRAIGRINPTTQKIDEFSTGLNSGSRLYEIAAGPDGNIWFTDEGTTPAVGRITPAGAIHEFSTGSGTQPDGIAAGPDGNVWFADNGTTKAIGRITPAGQITDFSAGLSSGSYPVEIAAGPDGALWFGDESTPCCMIGRITTAGAITEFPTSLPTGDYLTQGPDGNMWFTTGSAIGRITTPPTAATTSAAPIGQTAATVAGTANGHAQATTFHVEYGPVGGPTTTTPDQSLGTTSADTPASMTLTGLTPSTAYRARVVVTNPTDTTVGAFLTFTTAAQPPPPPVPPTLNAVRQSAKKWREGKALVHIARTRRPPVGTTFRFTLNEAARVRFAFTQTASGRKVKGKCVAPTKANKNRPRCTRSLTVARISFVGHKGINKVRFQGRVSRFKRLKLGRYTLVITATNSAGQKSTPHKLAFTIVRG